MDFRTLFSVLTNRLGRLPDTYLVFDIETSGFSPEAGDVILQVGHCLVVDGAVADRRSVLLDWTKTDGLVAPPHPVTLAERVRKTGEQIRAGGKAFHTDWERCRAEGEAPAPILEAYREWFGDCNQSQAFLVTHNGYAFDCRFFEHHFQSYLPVDPLGVPFQFADNNILDTGCLLKAAQLAMTPAPHETLRAFFARVANRRAKGVRWSLNEYAVPLFGLGQAGELSDAQAHDAGYDSYVTHLLLSRMRAEAARPAAIPHPAVATAG